MPTPAVSVTDLTVRFGDHTVLDGISFEASAGDFVAVVGPNGAGKTTLIKVLLGVVAADDGTVRVFAQRPTRADAGIVGYVPQMKTLDRSFPALASDLVLSALHQRWPGRVSMAERRRAVEALDQVGAAHLADQSLGTLSGGELQRVYLARSFIRSPRLILLDEPATGVDEAGAADLYELLDDYQDEHAATVLMVTHDWTAAYHHASHVLLLDGRQIGYGPPSQALSEECLRTAFGHIGHAHAMLGGH
jgi:zinc transport system ATP-binding protein